MRGVEGYLLQGREGRREEDSRMSAVILERERDVWKTYSPKFRVALI